jgi:pimeloyl-ACP methyl ester carboxylesterase
MRHSKKRAPDAQASTAAFAQSLRSISYRASRRRELRSVSMPSFAYQGRRIGYAEHGSGPRVIVLIHGLLMDSRMFTKLAPMLASHGHRVITADMLGHGTSDQPHVMTEYSMPQFGRDALAVLDHLEIAQAVVAGTSLGANVALEAAVAAPERVRALVLEMPVLENALPAAAAAFVPLALVLRASQRLMTAVAALTQPTLVIGHPSDPIHPFSDADRTARELPNARLVTASSMLEWRLHPDRLDRELLGFLEEVWQAHRAVA